ncbi:unnamed protein product [Miscanthus lutarioriparius]|uniref:Uncharacterized protein n=1 Tax=Miscanthus lutarioriparius TaxID=422564 RepID=A0A811PC32_9POAL|nr:unnamed protein product [Miscanthus lutarioriparius]
METAKACILLFTAFFFSGLMQLTMAQDKPAPVAAATAVVRVIDAKAIDQAIAYLLMFAALFVTYFAS